MTCPSIAAPRCRKAARAIGRVIAFDVGVELGQIAALAVMLPVVLLLRRSAHWQPIARIANGALIVGKPVDSVAAS